MKEKIYKNCRLKFDRVLIIDTQSFIPKGSSEDITNGRNKPLTLEDLEDMIDSNSRESGTLRNSSNVIPSMMGILEVMQNFEEESLDHGIKIYPRVCKDSHQTQSKGVGFNPKEIDMEVEYYDEESLNIFDTIFQRTFEVEHILDSE